MKYLYHHLGLGDHIICNGLIRSIVTNSDKYFLFVKNHNIGSVRFMFRDLDNLDFILVENDSVVESILSNLDLEKNKTIRIGFSPSINNPIPFDEFFYLQMNIPFKNRWEKFYVVRDKDSEKKLYQKLNPNNEKFVLIHKDGSIPRRFNYEYPKNNYKKIYVENITNNMFDFLLLAEKAEEIHCVQSSFECLVDSLDLNKNLFHHFMEPYDTPPSKIQQWITV